LSVSKSRATNSLLRSERKSLIRFLQLYVGLVILLLIALAVIYYEAGKRFMLSEQRADLNQYAYIQTKRLKVLHHYFDERVTYPRDSRFRSAIFDNEYHEIFSLLKQPKINFKQEIYLKDGKIHFVETLDEFYLGTRYLVLEVDDDGVWSKLLWRNILAYGGVIWLFFMGLGIFLANRFVKPMRDSIMLLDRFIKDTTHELNTPLAAILANIEIMDLSTMQEKNRRKLERINAAAITVSLLYKDLTYLTLEQEHKNKDEWIDIVTLLEERMDYFRVLSLSRELSCQTDLERAVIYMDQRKLIRVVDNLLSNAIKYNKRNGTVGIILRQGSLTIWDTGIGIKEEQKEMMFDRYMRFEESEGGFGVGLSIVKNITDEYRIKIEVVSKLKEGTRITLLW